MSAVDSAGGGKAVDGIQRRMTEYAENLRFSALTPEAVHAVNLRVLDTLGVLVAGFSGEPGRRLRNLAATMPHPAGATVLGTRMKTTPDMAAMVTATTMRYTEFTDVNHWPGSYHGHPSDVITPLLAVAEHVQCTGRELITSIVLAYEIYLRFAALLHNPAFDHTNLCCLSTAAGAGKLLKLSYEQYAHCIAMAVVPNNILTQSRLEQKTTFKVAVTGLAGRAGVFAALLARAGMKGPHLPFEGKAGWCDHVARERVSLGEMGGNGVRYKILDTRIRHRAAMGETHSSIFAAEKLALKIGNVEDVRQVTVEVYKRARDLVGSRAHEWCWDPRTRESADNSLPYVVAAVLLNGTVNLSSYTDTQIWDPRLRALLAKIDVVENAEFTKAFDRVTVRDVDALRGYDRLAREHHTRITVRMCNGEQIVAQAGGDVDDISVQQKDSPIEEKFRSLTEDILGSKRTGKILESLRNLQEIKNVADIPPEFVIT